MPPKKTDSSITVDVPLSRSSSEPAPLESQFPAETVSGNERPTSRSHRRSKPGRKGQPKEDQDTPPPWVALLLQEFQEMKVKQSQLQERLQTIESPPPLQSAHSRSQSRTVRQRFSKTPVPVLNAEDNSADEDDSPDPVNTSRQGHASRKTARQKDLDQLRDGTSPTFDVWLTGILDKFTVNHDHFADDEAKCAYIYGQTVGDAQKHLHPRWKRTSKERYQHPDEMIETLSDIYGDPDEEENARLDYLDLQMRREQPFSEFYTQFLHLAGTANIPRSEMKRDLPQKITTDLQRALLPSLHSFRDYQSIAEQCTRLDQGLRRIATQEAKNRPAYNARKALAAATKTSPAPTASATLGAPGILPVARQLTAPPPPAKSSPRAVANKPFYANPQRQFESNNGLCYNCGKPDHLKADCPEPKKPSQIFEINEEDRFEEVDEDSGNEDA